MARQNLRIVRSKGKAESPDELQIIRLCQKGDSRAFEFLVEKHRNRVFGIAYHLVLDSEDARDITQQTFIKLWKSLPDYDEARSFASWVCRIAANCSIDFLRSRKKVEPFKDIPLEHFSLDRRIDIRKIFLRIAPVLPERQRIVLVLREINELEMSEIAELLDCTESTVRNLLSQAKENFRKKIKEYFPEYGM